MIRRVKTFCKDFSLNLLLHEVLYHKKFNSLKLRVDVDIVRVVNKFNVTARGHGLETVSTQELDTGSTVATPLLCFAALCNFSGDNCLRL